MPEQYKDDDLGFDPWETSSGLPDRITVRIDNPHFGTDAQINNGQTTLFIPEGTIIAGMEDGSAGEFAQFYSCGDGWEPASKGTRVAREDGKPRKISGSSNYGKLFSSLLSAATEQGMDADLRKRGTPFDAGTWAGLEVYMEREAQPEFTGRDGAVVKRDLLVIKRIDKMPGAKGTAKSAPAAEETVEGSTSVGSSNGDGGGDIDPKIKAKLRAVARECESHTQFVERGLDVDGVLDDPKAEQAVMDAGAGSIWASVHADA